MFSFEMILNTLPLPGEDSHLLGVESTSTRGRKQSARGRKQSARGKGCLPKSHKNKQLLQAKYLLKLKEEKTSSSNRFSMTTVWQSLSTNIFQKSAAIVCEGELHKKKASRCLYPCKNSNNLRANAGWH